MKYHVATSNKTIWQLLFFAVVGICFYLIYRYSLFLDDDYLFSFVWGTDRPVTSIKDALYSQSIAYMEGNGRFLVHSIVHLFCGVWGMTLFGVCNTLMFLLLCWITRKLTSKDNEHLILKGIILITLFWFFLPVPGITFLGNIAFSVNYLWTSVGILGFLWVYQQRKNDSSAKRWWHYTALMIFGILVGSLQEGVSIGIAGALFLYYCFHFKELRGQALFLVLGFWIGSLIILLAPGNFIRMENEQGALLHSSLKWLALTKLSYFKEMLFGIPVFLAVLLTLTGLFIGNRRYCKQFVRENHLYIGAILIDILFALVIAYNGKWQITCPALFAIILLAKWLFDVGEKWLVKYRIIVVSTMLLFVCSTYIPAYRLRQKLFQEHQELVRTAAGSTDGMVWGNYEVLGHVYQNNYDFLENYFRVVFYMGDEYHKRLLSGYLTKGKNMELITCVLPFSPEKIATYCSVDNQIIPDLPIYTAGNNPFLIICTDDSVTMQQLLTNETYIQQVHDILTKNKTKNTAVRFHGLGSEAFQFQGKHYVISYNRLLAGLAGQNKQ